MWRTAVGSSSGRVVLRLTNDPRFIAGVTSAVAEVAERAGYPTSARADLVAAAEQVCRDALPLLTGAGAQLSVTIKDFPDRIEVTLERKVRVPPRARPGTNQVGRPVDHKLLGRVNHIRYDTQGETSRITLVKYVRSPSPQE